MKQSAPRFSIAAVERDVGLSKDVLRVWERRYGFPSPERDGKGERVYPADQVERLRLVKRLMDQGHRPGRLLPATMEELAALQHRRVVDHRWRATQSGADGDGSGLGMLLERIGGDDAEGLVQTLQRESALRGLGGFVQDIVAPLAQRVGEAWAQGRMRIHEEHLFTEVATRVLRQGIAALPAGTGPRVLLTTLPDEQHGLGLLMVEALLALQGAQCVALGTQMPMLEIVEASRAHRADVVALSFSGAFPARQVPGLIAQLRQALPAEVALWAGGAGTRACGAVEGAVFLRSLGDAVAELGRLRS